MEVEKMISTCLISKSSNISFEVKVHGCNQVMRMIMEKYRAQ